jgi:hypothetical protein
LTLAVASGACGHRKGLTADAAADDAETADACASCDGGADAETGDAAAEVPALATCGDPDAGAASDLAEVGSGPACASEWCLVTGVATHSGPSLRAVWGSGANDVWAVGDSGAVLHGDGTAWAPVPSGTDRDLRGVWGSGASDVWAVGEGEVILHWDGRAWSTVLAPAVGPALMAVWGSAANDVWAVARGGTIVHWDGAAWTSVSSGTTDDLFGVSGTSATNAWALSAKAILHWDGAAWSESQRLVADLRAIWSDGATDGWAVGGPWPQRWDGTKWSQSATGHDDLVDGTYGSVWGTAPTDVWAVGTGGSIRHWTGAAWVLSSSGTALDLGAVWGSGPSSVWAVGNGVILHFDGARWRPVLGDGEPLTKQGLVAGFSTGPDDAWAIGQSIATWLPSAVLHWDGLAWTARTDAPLVAGLSAVWGSGPRDVWFVGEDWEGQGNLVHWNGTGWTATTIGPSSTSLEAVWGTGPSDVWAVGGGLDATINDGRILHWNGTEWSDGASATPEVLANGRLWTVGGRGANDVWANGAITLHWDGTAWSRADVPPEVGTFGHLWGSGAGGDLWELGAHLARWDGHAWTPVCQPPLRLSILTGSSDDDLWLLGLAAHAFQTTNVSHWNGQAFTFDALDGFAVIAAWLDGRGALWATGDYGTILRRKGP